MLRNIEQFQSNFDERLRARGVWPSAWWKRPLGMMWVRREGSPRILWFTPHSPPYFLSLRLTTFSLVCD